jgi:hypothetical protein
MRINLGASVFTIYSETQNHLSSCQYLAGNTFRDVALAGGVSGATSGAVTAFGLARTF